MNKQCSQCKKGSSIIEYEPYTGVYLIYLAGPGIGTKIEYCPWCGRKLDSRDTRIELSKDELELIYLSMSIFILKNKHISVYTGNGENLTKKAKKLKNKIDKLI